MTTSHSSGMDSLNLGGDCVIKSLIREAAPKMGEGAWLE